ncbi:phage gene 29 protein family protein [Nocardia transvalensis]|uniref:phage gene 29 protein family protein n=1 Tax=Nocardia transvalensis TaxID=37333 RepID=UPI001895C89E|nr:DUF2744 domain-containing protein [Nocardia transvalensis]MBF6333450.1 DUF2744 domain-containing protein [Nocardia transvalensis]
MTYPTVENCDPSNPRKAFKWAFVALPFKGSTPLLVQSDVQEELSQWFWELGFRWHPELATKKVQPPAHGQSHTLNNLVRFVAADTPNLPPADLPRRGGFIEPPTVFDPSAHDDAAVIDHLRRAEASERARVITREMCGRNRASVIHAYTELWKNHQPQQE